MADKLLKTLKFSEDGDTYYPLPIVTADDAGKNLVVDETGEWAAKEDTSASVQIVTWEEND